MGPKHGPPTPPLPLPQVVSQVGWTHDGQVLTISTMDGEISSYLAVLPMVFDYQGTRVCGWGMGGGGVRAEVWMRAEVGVGGVRAEDWVQVGVGVRVRRWGGGWGES